MSIPTDAWGDEPSRPTASFASASGSSTSKSKATPNTVVRDDWELDDEEDEEPASQVASEERNRQIWEDANTKEHHPMPTVVISRGVAAPIMTPSLPLNQPPAMRILKRPSASPSASSTTVTPAGETLQEKEARYQAARERIFGASDEGSKEATAKSKNAALKKGASPSSSSTPPPSATKVVREPRGPPNNNINASGQVENKGFGERKTKRPPPSTVSNTPTDISLADIPT